MSSKRSSRSCTGGNYGGSSGSGPCGACKFLRRKCLPGCVFAPYFDSEQGTAHFAAVHKVFGASNVSKLLLHIPVHMRLHGAITICYEAQARVRDPVFGCVAHIFALQQQAVKLRAELSYLQTHLATSALPRPPLHPQAQPPPPSPIKPSLPSIANLPSAFPTTSDVSLLLDPVVQNSQAIQHPMLDPCPMGSNNSPSMDSRDQQLVHRQMCSAQFTGASPFPYFSKRA